MGSRGRANVLELTSHPLDSSPRRLPPHDMSTAEREVWISVVNCESPDWFTPSNAPLLVQYCRHVVAAKDVSRRVEACDPANNDEYLKLSRVMFGHSFAIMALATKMRLTQQSTISQRGTKKPRTEKASRQLYDR